MEQQLHTNPRQMSVSATLLAAGLTLAWPIVLGVVGGLAAWLLWGEYRYLGYGVGIGVAVGILASAGVVASSAIVARRDRAPDPRDVFLGKAKAAPRPTRRPRWESEGKRPLTSHTLNTRPRKV